MYVCELILPKSSTKNEPQINLGGVSGGPWGLLAAKIEKTRMAPELLGPLGAILALKIAQEPPKTPSKTHLGARTRPDLQNDSKMEPPTPQNGAPDPSFWIDFGANFCDF